jgi:hypothetical protein
MERQNQSAKELYFLDGAMQMLESVKQWAR